MRRPALNDTITLLGNLLSAIDVFEKISDTETAKIIQDFSPLIRSDWISLSAEGMAELRKNGVDATDFESAVGIFRKRLLAMCNNTLLAEPTKKAAHTVLIALATLKPLNQDSYISLETIPFQDAVFVSTGHQFMNTELYNIVYKNGYRTLKNPYTN